MIKQHNCTSRTEKQEADRYSGLPLILLLMLLTLVTSGIAGFILGNRSGTPSLGQIIDTILLSPDLPPAEETIHLTGRVFYTDGMPAASRSMELHSNPLSTVTNSDGGFLFSGVPEGEHTIYVLNSDGTAAAHKEIEIVRDGSTKTAVSVDMKTGGGYLIELSIDVRILEIEIELDNHTLFIDPERISYANRDGMVTTPAGTASIRDGVVVTPGGNVYLPDGKVVLPGGEENDTTYIILADDTVCTDQQLSAGDIEVSADGTVTLPDGTQIRPGGVIISPDGETEMPGQSGVVIGNGTVTPIGGSGDRRDVASNGSDVITQPVIPPAAGEPDAPTIPNTPADAAGPEDNVADEKESAAIPGASSNPGSFGESAEGGNSGDQENSDDGGGGIPDNTDKGSLYVEGAQKDGSYVSWEQNSIIDLFYNPQTGQSGRIAPGSSGFYLFRLKNTREEKLTVTIYLKETAASSYLPLQFTLKRRDQEGNAKSGSLTEGKILTLNTALEKGEEAVYQLDWVWPFESGNDAADTAAGKQGGTYTLDLRIHAEGGG